MQFDDYLNEPLPPEIELDRYYASTDELIIFEIGACEGEDTIKLRRKFPKAQIHTFEPLPKNVVRMKKNYKKYGADNIHIHPIALSDRDGKSVFHVSSGHPDHLPKTKNWDYGNKSSSLLPPKEHKSIHKWIKFNKKISVTTQRLETFCKQNSIREIDFVFLDVQGAELMVLKGAGKLLRNIKMIWMEVEAVELYAGQPLKNDVEQFMETNGFKRIKDTVGNVAGDQLYINEQLQNPSVLVMRIKQLIKLLRVSVRSALSYKK